MKNSILTAVLGAGLVAGAYLLASAAIPAGPVGIRIHWDYPPEEIAGTTFRIYRSPKAAVPDITWELAAVVTGQTNVNLTVSPGRSYYSVTASNFWGEGNFSSVASTPALPRDDQKVYIEKGS